jgi:hypothetical protein
MIARYLFLAILACLLILPACEIPDNPTYGPDHPDPNPAGTAPAVLTAVTPNVGFLNEVVSITGSGFNPNPDDNLVQFGTGVGTVLEATATELTVKLPALQGVTVMCRVAVKGAVEWSNELPVTFNLAIVDIALGLNWPQGVEADDAGNVYIGSNSDETVYKVDPDGNQTVYAAGVPVSGAMRWGPNGDLFVCTDWSGVTRISDNGATVESYVDVGSAKDFDWAENGNMYIISNGGHIEVYDGAAVTRVDDSGGEYKSCRIFGNYLYVTDRGDDQLCKFPITAGGLGDKEVISEDNNPVGIEIDANGLIIVTSTRDYSLFTYDSDGVDQGALFDGELGDEAESNALRAIRMHGKFVYAAYPGGSGNGAGSVKRIYVGVEAAPNWGLSLP